MRRTLINTLNSLGFEEITEAEDGQDALSKLQSDKFDLIVTGWNMPNMNGLDLTKAIRASESWKHIPIIMISERSLKEDVLEAIQAKVDGYILKPFSPQVLYEKIIAVSKGN
jgi:two-component system chemotaxis response regulator CheY